MHRGIQIIVIGLLPLAVAASAQPKHEFRGAWIATVRSLDWPDREAHPYVQQADLVQMLDRLQAVGVNAVFFQVRSEADAMYASNVEPWSYWLTGNQGTPPGPYYDPLAVAIAESHKRGMELHAWFNPYRTNISAGYPTAPGHLTNAQPDLLYRAGPLILMDPGKDAVRDYIVRVIMDVVRRYDVDGIHIDDYFYPYPPNEITMQDTATFAADHRGFTSLKDWRRNNVDLLVAQIADSLRAYDPYIKWGISPFGIYTNNVPEGIVGFDAYDAIFADPLAWLQAGTIDYLVPQLYWPFDGDQDYDKLARWWAEQRSGRQLYIGHALTRTDPETFSGRLFSADEIPRQIQFNRDHENIQGSVIFRAQNLSKYYSQGIFAWLREDLYRHPALTPSMPYKDQAPPPPPTGLMHTWTGPTEVTLTWTPPASGATRYAVYRIASSRPPDVDLVTQDAANLLAVTGEATLADYPEPGPYPYFYFVRSVSRNSVESAASAPVVVHARAPAVRNFVQQGAAHLPVANAQVEFNLEAGAAVSIRILDALGQELQTLTQNQPMNPGTHRYAWDGTDQKGRVLRRGLYFVLVDQGSKRTVKPVVAHARR